MASFLHPFFLSLSYPVKFLSSPSSSPVSLCPLDTNATRLVGSIVSFVADFAKPNAGRNIYQIDPWQCKESNGTPIENSSRRSISTVVSTTNRQQYVCVYVCDFFKLLRQKSTQTLRHFSFLFFSRQFFTRAFVSRVPQQFRQRSCWTPFIGHGSHHRGPPGLLLGHLAPPDSRPVLVWYRRQA
jgi:hypothetical protein